MRRTSLVSIATALLAAGGVSLAAAAPYPREVPIYDSTQLALDRYTVVKRIGVQDWQSAFSIRGHGSPEAARQALVNEAARLGADGLINLTCFDQTDGIFRQQGYFCYGNAIKVRK
jgi:uncharacterized protein YbjQ (UPF0145 family)